MWTVLWQATGLNKLWPHLMVAAVTILIIATAYLQGRSSGSKSAITKQHTDWLSQYSKEVKNRADIQAMRSNDARDRLRERWSND